MILLFVAAIAAIASGAPRVPYERLLEDATIGATDVRVSVRDAEGAAPREVATITGAEDILAFIGAFDMVNVPRGLAWIDSAIRSPSEGEAIFELRGEGDALLAELRLAPGDRVRWVDGPWPDEG